MTRIRSISHHLNMLEQACEALERMAKRANEPADLSDIAVGSLAILKKQCEVKFLYNGDNVFGIMSDITEDDKND